jgi:uncharacterized protein (TIGR00661 family)
MARILYSCCGEGQGHSSRVLTITRALAKLGHEVKILASHKAFKVLQPRLPDVQEIPGFTFVYQNNRVELLASFWGNLPLVSQRRRIIRNIVKLIEDWQPHLAITDFEPFLPRAAELAGLRCIVWIIRASFLSRAPRCRGTSRFPLSPRARWSG